MLATNNNLSLFYRVDLKADIEVNKAGLKFEQIVTISKANKLMQVNSRQLVATSKTQICVFSLQSTECDDIKYLFTPENKETQHKRLIGKNIDLKVDFDSNIMATSTDQSIVSVIFGSQSLLLEFDESTIPEFINDGEAHVVQYKKSINSLNDLIYVFKQILHLQYHNEGYIRISEDQGNWDNPQDTFCPVGLCVADYVTLIQDDEGN